MSSKYLTSSKDYVCPKCGAPFHYQLHRNFFVRAFSLFKPVRRFFCAKCKKAYNVVLDKTSSDQ